MDRHQLKEELARRIGGLLSEETFDLWELELVPQSGRLVLRVLVDRASGVTLEDCAYWSRKIGRFLEAEDLLPGRYVLEVGSPGIERTLSRPEHFARFVGSCVEVRLHDPQNGRRTFRGALLEAGAESVLVEDADSGRVSVPYAAIRRSHLIVDPWEGLRSQGRGPKGKLR
jgi:ribosome maturation factor RimP